MKKYLALMIALFVIGSFAGCNVDGNVGNSPGVNDNIDNNDIIDNDILRNDNDDDDLNGIVGNNRTNNNNGTNNTQKKPANG